MNKLIRIAVASVAALTIPMTDASAQAPDTVQLPYVEMNAVGALNASQAGYRNWTEGGVSTLLSTALVTGMVERTSSNWLQTYETRLAFGIVKQDTLNLRKADDLIRATGQISYRGDGAFTIFQPTAAAGIRTQFAPGYNYETNPLGDGQMLPVKVSDVFSPATFTQSIGLTYRTDWGLKQRFGVAAKETAILIERLRPVYGQPLSDAVRFQLGIESHTEIDYTVAENVRYKLSLSLFAAFRQENLPDMLWENVIVMKVNSWLSTDFELVMLYDRDISSLLQMRQTFSVGLSVALI